MYARDKALLLFGCPRRVQCIVCVEADVMFALGLVALYAAPSSKFDRVIVLREKAPDDLSDVLFLLSFTLLFVPSSFFALLAPSLLLRVNLVAAHSRSSSLNADPFYRSFDAYPLRATVIVRDAKVVIDSGAFIYV